MKGAINTLAVVGNLEYERGKKSPALALGLFAKHFALSALLMLGS